MRMLYFVKLAISKWKGIFSLEGRRRLSIKDRRQIIDHAMKHLMTLIIVISWDYLDLPKNNSAKTTQNATRTSSSWNVWTGCGLTILHLDLESHLNI